MMEKMQEESMLALIIIYTINASKHFNGKGLMLFVSYAYLLDFPVCFSDASCLYLHLCSCAGN